MIFIIFLFFVGIILGQKSANIFTVAIISLTLFFDACAGVDLQLGVKYLTLAFILLSVFQLAYTIGALSKSNTDLVL